MVGEGNGGSRIRWEGGQERGLDGERGRHKDIEIKRDRRRAIDERVRERLRLTGLLWI